VDGRLSAVRLHPLVLGHGLPRAQRGRPVLARGEAAQRILARIARLSRQFGTEIALEGDCGVIRVAP
jgi:poly-gamma-glutamate synthesis protein (capsule biosynthesis protein)